MTARIGVVYRIVITVTVQIQAVDGVGGEVGSTIGRDKSAPLGAVITSVAVIEASVVIVVIATVTNGVCIGDGIVGGFAGDGTVAPGIIQILGHHIAAGITYILPNFPPAVKKKSPRDGVKLL